MPSTETASYTKTAKALHWLIGGDTFYACAGVEL